MEHKIQGLFSYSCPEKPNIEAIRMFNFGLEELLYGYILGYAKLSDVIIYNSEKEFMKDKFGFLRLWK